MKNLILLFLALLLLPVVSQAAIEEYAFEEEVQEERFKQLTYEMRCPKCLNSNIAGSDAPIAADLRKEVYDQILEGRTDQEILDFMSSRYGDFILYRPRLTAGTLVLWFGPALLLLGGIIIVRRMMLQSQDAATETGLTQKEQEELDKLLDRD
ncbi:MAG: cytochrome c-type biogenesis protein CcmH [Gammaproteobacteria bacterium]|nr:cytochrome c-type biogenesis protein CcmH [Gammaproteobacteria bacterium]